MAVEKKFGDGIEVGSEVGACESHPKEGGVLRMNPPVYVSRGVSVGRWYMESLL